MTDVQPVPGVIRIKNWKRFQNYKFRNPPWIRLYGDLLDQPWYRPLSDNATRFLVELWLLARRDKGTIPYDSLMILRDLKRPTSDKPLLDAALTELASVDACTVAGADASAAFLNTLAPLQAQVLAHRVTESQSIRVSVPSEPARAAQENTNRYGFVFGLIRAHLWKPDGQCPETIAGKPWSDDREGTVIRDLLKSYSLSDLEVIVTGLGYMLRGLAESERPEWLTVGEKASLRAVFHTRSGVVQMVEHCRRAFWSVENKKPKKPATSQPTSIGDLSGVLP